MGYFHFGNAIYLDNLARRIEQPSPFLRRVASLLNGDSWMPWAKQPAMGYNSQIQETINDSHTVRQRSFQMARDFQAKWEEQQRRLSFQMARKWEEQQRSEKSSEKSMQTLFLAYLAGWPLVLAAFVLIIVDAWRHKMDSYLILMENQASSFFAQIFSKPWVQGDLAAARPLFERVLAIYEKALGPEHPPSEK
jgi:Tetratricopeptide repeat